jgi:hypothetical protein
MPLRYAGDLPKSGRAGPLFGVNAAWTSAALKVHRQTTLMTRAKRPAPPHANTLSPQKHGTPNAAPTPPSNHLPVST